MLNKSDRAQLKTKIGIEEYHYSKINCCSDSIKLSILGQLKLIRHKQINSIDALNSSFKNIGTACRQRCSNCFSSRCVLKGNSKIHCYVTKPKKYITEENKRELDQNSFYKVVYKLHKHVVINLFSTKSWCSITKLTAPRIT